MNDIPKVEELFMLIIPLNDFDFFDRELFGEFACRSTHKNDKSVRLLRYNKHVW